MDRLIGLELSADNYICKPYSPREVIARIRAILRRVGILQNSSALKHESASQLLAGLHLDQLKLSAVLQGEKLELTAVGFQILHTQANESGRMFSR